MAAPREYLRFERAPSPGRKTQIVQVFSVHSGFLLGEIAWFSRWRQYTFWPEPGTTFNVSCLETINDEIRALMQERRLAGPGDAPAGATT